MWLVFRSFSTTPSFTLWITPQFLCKWKASWRYIILVGFIGIAFVVVKLYIFKVLVAAKSSMLAAFGWFFLDYNPESSPICTKFSPVMQWKLMYRIPYGFWYSAEKSKKLCQKTEFLAFFQRFFDHVFLRPMDHAQFFAKEKVS